MLENSAITSVNDGKKKIIRSPDLYGRERPMVARFPGKRLPASPGRLFPGNWLPNGLSLLHKI